MQDKLFRIQRRIIPDEATMIATSATQMATRLEATATAETERQDTSVAAVVIDRYIGVDAQNPRFFRLNVSRDRTRKQVSRPGEPLSPQEQYQNLADWLTRNHFQEVLLVDDAIGVGTTLIPIIRELQQRVPQIPIHGLVGLATSEGAWSGLQNVKEATNIDVAYLTLMKASSLTETSTGMSICNSRDMTILGGYLQEEDTQGRRIASPHLLPFTVTVAKNFTAMDKRLQAAELLLDFNLELIDFLEERIGKPLQMRGLLDSGFGMPSSNVSTARRYMPSPLPEDQVRQSILQAQKVLKEHKKEILEEVNFPQRRGVRKI